MLHFIYNLHRIHSAKGWNILTRNHKGTETVKIQFLSSYSTVDLSRVDQLTFPVRYVTDHGALVQRFLKFTPIYNHQGSQLTETLNDISILITECRGPCYDNASCMSGQYNRLQAHINKLNPFVEYALCAAHSLNLVENALLNVVCIVMLTFLL